MEPTITLGLYRDNGKENGNDCLGFRVSKSKHRNNRNNNNNRNSSTVIAALKVIVLIISSMQNFMGDLQPGMPRITIWALPLRKPPPHSRSKDQHLNGIACCDPQGNDKSKAGG